MAKPKRARVVDYDNPETIEKLRSIRSAHTIELRVYDIHVICKPRHPAALCGAKVLPQPAVIEHVELGAARPDGSAIHLDEVELESGWIAMLPRHFERKQPGDLCRRCLEHVARLRAKKAQPAISKEQRKADRDKARSHRKAEKHAAFEAKMLDDDEMPDEEWILE